MYREDAQRLNLPQLKQTVNLNLSKQPIIANNIPIIETK